MTKSIFAVLKRLAAPKATVQPGQREVRPLPSELLGQVGGGKTPRLGW